MTQSDTSGAPPLKAMVSYAWGNEAQQARVKGLVDQLRGDGVDVIFDRYHLREGDDANAFMEQVAASGNVQKVIAICDPKYVERMNSRQGGSGQEGMIMSPHVYAQLRSMPSDDSTRERRFIAVIFARNPELNKDDPGHLPTMFGSMKYIDMSTPDDYDANYEQLLRFLLNKPEFVAPPVGKIPHHLRGAPQAPLPGRSQASTIARMIEQGRDALPAWRTYLDQIDAAIRSVKPAIREEGERIEFSISEMLDEAERFLPLRDLFVETLIQSVNHNVLPTDALIEFFEGQLDISTKISEANRTDSKSFSAIAYSHSDFIKMELFLYTAAILVDRSRADVLKELTDHTYFDGRNGRLEPVTFGNIQHIYERSKIEELYKNHSGKNWYSPIGAWIASRANLQTVPLTSLIQADLILFLKSMIQKLENSDISHGYRWMGRLGPHIGHEGVPRIFIKWMSQKRIQPWLEFFASNSTDELRNKLMQALPNETFGNTYVPGGFGGSVGEFLRMDGWATRA